MKFSNLFNVKILTACVCLLSVSAHAEVKYSIGAKLLPAHQWNGSNYRDGESDFSATSNQLVLIGAFRNNRLYGAYSLQGAQYSFATPAPDINDSLGSAQTSDQKVKLGESDLTLGYYVTPTISLFADIKSVAYGWTESGRHLSYTGLGMGVSAVHPLRSDWMLYGNFGVIGNMNVSSNGDKIGKASGFALEFGGITRLSSSLSATVGLKIQGQELRFDSGNKQKHGRSGLVFGIMHQF